MTESSFYTRLLHPSENWSVSTVNVNEKAGEVEVEISIWAGRHIAHSPKSFVISVTIRESVNGGTWMRYKKTYWPPNLTSVC